MGELNRVRTTVVKQLHDRLDLAQQIAVTSVESAQERADALFGTGFMILPELSPAAGGMAAPLDPAATPDGADTASVRQFIARSAAVRAAANRLDRHLAYVEALQTDAPTLTVTQIPLAPGDRWIALGFDPTAREPLAGRVALVTYQPLMHSSTITGLLVDEWLETTPNRRETTGLTFHYDAPTSAAPNACLLAVPPPATRWSPDLLRDTIVEAVALARLRTVDPDILAGAGQLLPPLWTVENTSGDTASINVLSLLGGA
jgi:hypothetical protein